MTDIRESIAESTEMEHWRIHLEMERQQHQNNHLSGIGARLAEHDFQIGGQQRVGITTTPTSTPSFVPRNPAGRFDGQGYQPNYGRQRGEITQQEIDNFYRYRNINEGPHENQRNFKL